MEETHQAGPSPAAGGLGSDDPTKYVCIKYRGKKVYVNPKAVGKDEAVDIKTDIYNDFHIPLSLPCVLRKSLSGGNHVDFTLTGAIPAGEYDLILKTDALRLPLQLKNFDVHQHAGAFAVTLKPSAQLTQDDTFKLSVSLVFITAVLEHHYFINKFSVTMSPPKEYNITDATPQTEPQSIVVCKTNGTTVNIGATVSYPPAGTIGFGESNTVAETETVTPGILLSFASPPAPIGI